VMVTTAVVVELGLGFGFRGAQCSPDHERGGGSGVAGGQAVAPMWPAAR
jgi:uncharacterized spore protein YtfJ